MKTKNKILKQISADFNDNRFPLSKIINLMKLNEEQHLKRFVEILHKLFYTLKDDKKLLKIIKEERKKWRVKKGV
jgi:dihydroorotase